MLKFIPDPGMVLICDYQSGFIPPEMIKKRRVIVVSPKFLNNRGLCTVVPVSTTPPDAELPVHVRFNPGQYRFFSADMPCWAKCDVIASVSYARLDRIRIGKDFVAPRIGREDFEKIRVALSHVIAHY
jgi:mRNA interferase MazF